MQVELTQVITGVSVMLNFVLGFLAFRSTSDKSLVEATTMLIKPLQERLRTLETERDALQRRVDELEAAERLHQVREVEMRNTIEQQNAKIDLLVKQLKGANIRPVDFGAAG